jgi:hypothetical protein
VGVGGFDAGLSMIGLGTGSVVFVGDWAAGGVRDY